MTTFHAGRLAVVAGAIAVALFLPRTGLAQTPGIFVMNADGSGLRQLAMVPDHEWHSFARWSHDDKEIVFDARPVGKGANNTHLFKVSAEGGEPVDLGFGKMPCWSPDDKQILYYVMDRNLDRVQGGVWTMNANGNAREWLFTGRSPRYSPDGGRILFFDTPDSIYVYDVLEGTRTRVLLDEFQFLNSAAWSPDGKRLAVVGTRNGQGELVIIDARGSDKGMKVRLTGALSRNCSWEPGNKILLYQTVDGQQQMGAVDPDTDEPLVPFKNQETGDVHTDASWSHDGKRLVFTSNLTWPKQ